MGTSSRDLRVRYVGDDSALRKTIAGISAAHKSLGDKLVSTGRTLTTRLTLPIVGMGAAAFKTFNDFDQSMANVNSIMKVSGAQLGKFSDQVIALSTRLPQDAKTLADGLYNIASSGFQGADAMKVLEVSAKAASAGMSTTETASRAVTASLNAYGLASSQAGKVSDILFKGVEQGVMTFDELANSLGDYVGAAAQLKIPLQDVVTAQAAMTLQGISASEAATSLNQVMRSLLKPSEAMASTLKHFGFESGQAAIKALGLNGVIGRLSGEVGNNKEEWLKLFPEIRAARGAMALAANDGAAVAKVQESMADAVGATDEALKRQSKGGAYQWQLAVNRMKAALISFGEVIAPVVQKVAGFIADMADRFRNLSPETKEFIAKALAATAALGPLLVVIGKTANALKWLGTPISLATRGVGGLATGVSNFVLDLRTGAGGIAGFRTALSSAIGPMGAFAIAATAVVAAGVAVNNMLKKDDEAAAGWVEKINAGTTSLKDLKAAVDQVTGDKTLTDKFNGDQTVLDAYGKTVQQLSAQYLQMGADVHLSTTSQLAFSQAMLGSTQITKKQAERVVNMMGAYEKLKGPLDEVTLAAIKNLLAVGDEGDAYKLLQRLIEGALGPLRHMPRPTTLAAEAAADHAVKLQAEAAGLRAVSRAANDGLGPLRNWASAAAAAAEAAADLDVRRSFGGGTPPPPSPPGHNTPRGTFGRGVLEPLPLGGFGSEGGGSVTVVVNVGGSVLSERDLAEVVRREFIRIARRNGGRLGIAS